MNPPAPRPRRRLLLGIAVFLAAFLAVALTARDPGLTWDESIYYGRAAHYLAWFDQMGSGAFHPETLVKTWWTADHPPLGSAWIAGSFAVFGWLDMITAARMGAAIIFALAVFTLYRWFASRRGEAEGVMAAALFALMPRIFAHGHFANLEMMTLLLWLLTVVAFERGNESRRWSVLAGIFFGLSLLTKINGAFLPILLIPWGLLFHGRRSLRNLACMALIGPAIFFIGWPTMWVAPIAQLKAYLADKGAQRMAIPVYYLGEVYRRPFAPWHYPFVVMLVTTPLIVLIGAATGIWQSLRKTIRERRAAAHEALLLWAFIFPVLLLAMPNVPKYDGIRLMLPAYPFLAALAARGLMWLWDRIKARAGAVRTAAAGLAAVMLLAPVIAFHPYQLSYYNALVGWPSGAAKIGFETTYWDDTFDGKALAYLNEHVPQGGKVAFVALGDFVWRVYQLGGDARQDIEQTDFAKRDWDYLVVIPRQGWWTDEEWAFIQSHEPAWANTLPPCHKLPVCMIYARESLK